MTNRLVVAVAILSGSTLWAQNTRTDWRDYLGAPDSSHFSPLKQIDPNNIGKLQVAWSYETGSRTANSATGTI